MTQPPILLLIFDGFGLNPSRACNGWALARNKAAIPCRNH
jgi:bisphosphoglycerate-independent phosphoglycerate mutase (AlkP superfamily)